MKKILSLSIIFLMSASCSFGVIVSDSGTFTKEVNDLSTAYLSNYGTGGAVVELTKNQEKILSCLEPDPINDLKAAYLFTKKITGVLYKFVESGWDSDCKPLHAKKN